MEPECSSFPSDRIRFVTPLVGSEYNPSLAGAPDDRRRFPWLEILLV
jgi:hypothetical protein